MSDSQYLWWNNGDIIVCHGNFNQFLTKILEHWYFNVLKEPPTMFLLANAVQDFIKRAPAKLSPVEFTFHVSFLTAGIFSTPELFFCWVWNSSHIIRDLRHRFQQMRSTSMKNTFQDNYTILDTNNAHPEEVLTLLHFPNTAVFSNTKQTIIMYLMCAPTCMRMCLCMKLKLECFFFNSCHILHASAKDRLVW